MSEVSFGDISKVQSRFALLVRNTLARAQYLRSQSAVNFSDMEKKLTLKVELENQNGLWMVVDGRMISDKAVGDNESTSVNPLPPTINTSDSSSDDDNSRPLFS